MTTTLTLEQAEARLKEVEGPTWERKHAIVALNTLRRKVEDEQDPDVKELLQGKVAAANKRVDDAVAAERQAGFAQSDIDEAAQAVLDLRGE